MLDLKRLLLIILLFTAGLALTGRPQTQEERADSLRNAWKNTSLPDSVRLSALYDYTWEAYLFSNPDSALHYADIHFKIAQKGKDKRQMALSMNLKGTAYYLKGQYDKALRLYKKTRDLRAEAGDENGVADAYINISNVQKRLGNYPEAIRNLSEALSTHEKLGNEKSMATALNNIGILYYEQENYDKAEEYYQRSLAINKKNKIKDRWGDNLSNLGIIYYERKDYDVALDYYQQSLEMYKALKQRRGIAQSRNNIGLTYQKKGKYKRALDELEKALEIRREMKDPGKIANSHNTIGYTYTSLGDSAGKAGNEAQSRSYYLQAVDMHKRAMEIGKKIQDPLRIRNAAKGLYTSYKALDKAGNALENYRLFINLDDSIKSLKNQRAVIRQEYKHQYEKKAYADSVKQAEEKKLSQAKIQAQKAKLKQEKTQRYALYGGVGLLLLFGGFMFNRFRVTRKQKNIISDQKAEVEKQRNEAEHQKVIVEEKNSEILDSINYAKRLQEAILPPQKLVKQWLDQSFILYKPKDIVAGDFYWMETVGETVFFAAADCTGHGVPGAMVSVVCSNALSKAVIEENITDPGKILDRTRELVIERFGRSEQEIKDGMDIALCKLELPSDRQLPTANRQLAYAGAHNPLWIIRKDADEVEEIKADKQPIGRYATEAPFTTHKLKLKEGDAIYIFSDGFPDQFGGEKGKKYKSGRFKRLLLSIRDKDMAKQRELIAREFEVWKGNLDQIDDVCILGVKV